MIAATMRGETWYVHRHAKMLIKMNYDDANKYGGIMITTVATGRYAIINLNKKSSKYPIRSSYSNSTTHYGKTT